VCPRVEHKLRRSKKLAGGRVLHHPGSGICGLRAPPRPSLLRWPVCQDAGLYQGRIADQSLSLAPMSGGGPKGPPRKPCASSPPCSCSQLSAHIC
jgi:hypothetical protein